MPLTEEQVRAAPCPYCKAKPGASCVNPDDEPVPYMHYSREASATTWSDAAAAHDDILDRASDRRDARLRSEALVSVALTREQWATIVNQALYAGTQESVVSDEDAAAIESAIIARTGPLN